MIYKTIFTYLTEKLKTKKCKTVFSERIKPEVVIIWFTYLFVNIDTQTTFANWSEPQVYIFSEFIKVSFCFDMFWE